MEERFLIVANLKLNSMPQYNFEVPSSLEVAFAPQSPEIIKIPQNFTRAAQDVGESAQKLKDLGVKYCLVGHSYRRNNFNETNEIVKEKVFQLEKVGILPIVCARSLAEIVPAKIIMYEPEEAISINGQYHPETPENINTVLNTFPKDSQLLYGGSVNPDNCRLFLANCQLVTGFVVGHASLDPQTFEKIISACI